MTTRPKRKTTTSRNSGKGTTKPRETKRARLIGLLKRANGSGVATLSRELGWQQHTTRAALTGLRKAGSPSSGCNRRAAVPHPIGSRPSRRPWLRNDRL